jgi:hypothetical protein
LARDCNDQEDCSDGDPAAAVIVGKNLSLALLGKSASPAIDPKAINLPVSCERIQARVRA